MHFDAFVIVDWSAASKAKTGKDSIWIGVARRSGQTIEVLPPQNIATRIDAEAAVARLLEELQRECRRTLLGFDFPYGYPRGFASALGLPRNAPAWLSTWNFLEASIHNGQRNENDRFEVASRLNARLGLGQGPFWGCTARAETTFLGARHKGLWEFPYSLPDGTRLERLRECERRMPGVQEAWKLLGAGSVGSQSLLGIPVLARLHRHPALAKTSRAWPFETGFGARVLEEDGARIVHAEIWPSCVPLETDLHPVRDAAQVLTLARHLACLDAAGELEAWFREPVNLDARSRAACINEEGWILGAQ
jgi:hypothetical protein